MMEFLQWKRIKWLILCIAAMSYVMNMDFEETCTYIYLYIQLKKITHNDDPLQLELILKNLAV
jgi:hypothetical protein